MHMMNITSKNLVAGIKKYGALFVLALALFGAPQQAKAQYVVTDPADDSFNVMNEVVDAAGWVAQAAHYALEIQQWLVTNLDSIIHMLVNVLSQEVNAFSNMTGVQAGIDAQSRETQKKLTADLSLKYALNLPTGATATAGGTLGSTTGNNMCNTAMRAQAAILTNNAVDDMTHALSDMITMARAQQNSAAAQAELTDLCKRGFIDTVDTSAAFANNPDIKSCTSSAPTGSITDIAGNVYAATQWRNADLNPESVVGHNYYTMPVNVKVDGNTGQLLLPLMSDTTSGNPAGVTTSKEELDFIAAIYACRTYSRAIGAGDEAYTQTTVKATSNSTARYLEARYGMAAISAQNAPCLREVARRVRIPKALNPAAGTVLKEMYDAQVSRCEHLANDGIFHESNGNAQADLQECENDGRSQLEMDIDEHCALAHQGYHMYTAGRGLGEEEYTRVAVEHGGECGNFLTHLNEEKINFDAALRQLAAEHRDYDLSVGHSAAPGN